MQTADWCFFQMSHILPSVRSNRYLFDQMDCNCIRLKFQKDYFHYSNSISSKRFPKKFKQKIILQPVNNHNIKQINSFYLRKTHIIFTIWRYRTHYKYLGTPLCLKLNIFRRNKSEYSRKTCSSLRTLVKAKWLLIKFNMQCMIFLLIFPYESKTRMRLFN